MLLIKYITEVSFTIFSQKDKHVECMSGSTILYLVVCVQVVYVIVNPFMDGSFSEWLACAESAPHLPSYLTASAEQ